MVGAVAEPARGRPREALLRRLVRLRVVVEPLASRSRSAPASTARYESWILDQVVPVDPRRLRRRAGDRHRRRAASAPTTRSTSRSSAPTCSRSRSACRATTTRRPGTAGASAATAAYFNNPMDYLAHMGGDHLDWLRGRVSLLLVCGQGQWEDTTGALEQHASALAGLLAAKGIRARARPLGPRRAARLAVLARAARPSSAAVLLMATDDQAPDRPAARHRGGLADARSRRSSRRLGPIERRVRRDATASTTERITIEPFDLRDKPRYDLVVDRLAYWYYLPREWLKKVALMDDVYLLNSPFTFQSMEKHAAYCAMLRLGLKVPRTVLVPHKNPPDNARFAYTAAKYNQPFDLDEIADGGRLPAVHEALRRRPVGRRQPHPRQRRAAPRLRRVRPAADAPAGVGRGLRRLRALAVDRRRDDGHALPARASRCTTATPSTTTSSRPRSATRSLTISRLINAFFRWEFNSCETLVRGDRGAPDRLRQRVARRRAHQPALLLPVGDERAAEVVRVLRRHRPRAAARPRHAPLLRDRRPRGPLLRGEARRLPRAGRRVLRGRALPATSATAGSPHVDELVLDWVGSAGVRPPAASRPCARPTRAHEHERFIGADERRSR